MNIWHHLPDLYFLHIPKAAGTSLREIFADLFPEDSILPVYHLKQMEELPDEEILNARFASGHFGWRFVERAEALGKEIFVFTCLRDVVDLCASGMKYGIDAEDSDAENLYGEAKQRYLESNEKSRSGYFKELASSHVDLTDTTLLAQAESDPAANLMVRCLSGAGSEEDQPWPVTRADLTLAKRRLSEMAAFGLVEEIDEFLLMICAELGLPLLPPVSQANKSSSSLDMSEDFKTYLRLGHPFDDELYDYAKDLFHQRKVALRKRSGLPETAPREAFSEMLRNAVLRQNPAPKRISHATISMGDGLLSEGFGNKFFSKKFDRWIRWSTKSSKIYLPLQSNSKLNIRCEIAAFVNNVIREQLKLSINGRNIEYQRAYELWNDGAYHMIISAEIDESLVDKDQAYTIIEFHAPEDVATVPPSAAGDRISFALAEVEISTNQKDEDSA